MGLCDRWQCRPSQLLKEDASLLGLLAVVERGKPPQQDPGAPTGGDW